MACLVVTQNGLGSVLLFKSKTEARLHPVPQAYDVFAENPRDLVNQYGRNEIEPLLRFALGRDRSRVVDALEGWRSAPLPKELPFEFCETIWMMYVDKAVKPQTDAVDIVNTIKEDRRALETKSLRSRPESENPGEYPPIVKPKGNRTMTTAAAEKKTRAPRTPDDATITLKTDKNPKRAGSKSFERFAAYKDGMTVKEAKEAGITAADIDYDSKHDYISITLAEKTGDSADAGTESDGGADDASAED